ncbi:hypothetical protein ZIOFF_075392 [Zingiber officinale]|uniref:ATPase AAA-type core domain-containing protein n=1 Tax=Zingiber officinale TaxID=94328 RepID=A0A8J5CQ95_ZINOF|nr:hypothetical protein ZIOFF_075392 [Zingiber officinale]
MGLLDFEQAFSNFANFPILKNYGQDLVEEKKLINIRQLSQVPDVEELRPGSCGREKLINKLPTGIHQLRQLPNVENYGQDLVEEKKLIRGLVAPAAGKFDMEQTLSKIAKRRIRQLRQVPDVENYGQDLVEEKKLIRGLDAAAAGEFGAKQTLAFAIFPMLKNYGQDLVEEKKLIRKHLLFVECADALSDILFANHRDSPAELPPWSSLSRHRLTDPHLPRAVGALVASGVRLREGCESGFGVKLARLVAPPSSEHHSGSNYSICDSTEENKLGGIDDDANSEISAEKTLSTIATTSIHQLRQLPDVEELRPGSCGREETYKLARSLPKSRGDSHLTVDQLFLGLLEDSQIKDLLKDAGISDVARVRTLLMPLSYPIAITPSIDSDDQGIQLHSQSEKRDNSERRRIHEMRRWMDEIQILKRRQNMLSQWGETFGLADFKFESVQELDAAIAKLEGDVNDSLEQSSWAMPMKSSAPSRWNEKERLIGLAERLCERVVGQNQAVETVAEVVLRSRADSKTELAKALAEQLFGNENFLIRIDLSEYKEQRSLRRLIGGPLVDDEDGQLTAAVRRKPYSVVLFDRVEKAHDSVLKSLLHMLGLGRLADGQNWDVDFTNTVIIMTSNLTRTEKDSPLQIAREILIDEVCLLIYLK